MTTAAPQLSWEAIRWGLQRIAEQEGEWAGLPVPVDHATLRMEPRHPFEGLNGFKFGQPEDRTPLDFQLVNAWECRSRHVRVLVFREKDGRTTKGLLPAGPGRRVRYWFDTMAVAAQEAWTIETESAAMEKLEGLVNWRAFRCYFLSGCFLETSQRSGITYLFRKLRPTLAMSPRGGDEMRTIAALCLHPIGYYENTWAGCMCPTDDVIAHLLMMRGDERRFWGKANHHDLWEASAGL